MRTHDPVAEFTVFREAIERATYEIVQRCLVALRAHNKVPSTESAAEPLVLDSMSQVLREILRVAELMSKKSNLGTPCTPPTTDAHAHASISM
jgi:hypothetical protein